MSMLGLPSIKYKSPEQGMDPIQGFDCSGLICHILAKAQLAIPSLIVPEGIRHANEMFDHLGILVHPRLRKPGDLLIYSRDGRRPTHVAVCVTRDLYIHAPGINDTEVCFAQINESPIPFMHEGQIYDSNPIGFKRLTVTRRGGRRWYQEPI